MVDENGVKISYLVHDDEVENGVKMWKILKILWPWS